ncbi:MAG: ChaN family lipoprotein [Myxococcales bacterium]|nr:ChaN family lipoprotein [Myxococcales bacterium]
MRAALVVVLLAGCGPSVRAPERPRPPEIVDVATGERIGFETLVDRLAEARVVYVGERHDEAGDHDVQRRILEALAARRPGLALGFEMFQRPYQAVLDDYAAGRIDEPALLERTEWERRWGFDFAFYRPLVGFGREHGATLVALNAPQEVTRTIAREGLDGLPEDTRAALPELDRSDPAHRARVEEALREHPRMTDAMLERFYTAQLVWDETMATSVAEHDGPMIVFAGAMHVARDAIPARAARRGATPFLIVLPEDELPENAPVDYVWLRGR